MYSTTKLDPREAMIGLLMKDVPNGYFATQLDGVSKTNFLRISRPKHNAANYPDCIKIQTQHSEQLILAGIIWPDGRFSVYNRNLIDMLMLLAADWHTCARRYSKELGHYCRCNTELTDERSRWYGIGPVCDKIWTWMIEEVDNEHDGMTFEQRGHEA